MNLNNAGIYLITSQSSGKRYVGSAVRVDRRWAGHRCALKGARHRNPELQNIYNKHGLEGLVFSVVEVVDREGLDTQEFKKILLSREQWYIDNWLPEINIDKIAGSRLGHKASEATKAKSSAAHMGHKHTETTRSKMSETRRGNTNRRGVRSRRTKGYYYNKSVEKWQVELIVEGKKTYFGRFVTEKEAAARVAQLKPGLGFPPMDVL